MNNDDVQSLLRIADEEGSVPPDFKDQLWDEVSAIASRPRTLVIAPLDEHDRPIDLLVAESESEKFPSWVFAAAASLVVITVLTAVVLFRSGDDQTPVVSDDTPSVSTSVPAPDAAVEEASTMVSGPVGFATEPGITAVTDTALSLRFVTTADTVFTAVVRNGADVVATEGGNAVAGEAVTQELTRLDPQTRYSVQVTLLGPPSVVSSELEVTTASDPNDPQSVDMPIEIERLDVLDVDSTVVRFAVQSNICSTATITVLSAATRTAVANVETTPDTCADEHVLNLDIDSNSFAPETEYVAIASVTAFGDDRNTTTDTVEFTSGAE